MKVLLHPAEGDPAGLVAEGPFGERPPIFDGAIVLLHAPDGKPNGFPNPGASPPVLLNGGWARVMPKIVAAILDREPQTYRGKRITGPFDFERSDSTGHVTTVVNGVARTAALPRRAWRISSWQGGGGSMGDYQSLLIAEPWPEDTDYRVNLLVPGLAAPYDFGMWHGWTGAAAAYALGTIAVHLFGGRIEVRRGDPADGAS